ncbi:cupin domain-containing protein [Bradyrhizobium sp. B097]|uniref:cupin domain-containing protein n=1 Tax=Bradyrhizobium sp. B097 TaxID=3140244 RepID=UPI0031833A6C
MTLNVASITLFGPVSASPRSRSVRPKRYRHYHTEAQDTFYVINGTIRVSTREPEEEVCLTVGMTYSVRPGRPHLVANAGAISAVFLVLQGMGEHDFVPLI